MMKNLFTRYVSMMVMVVVSGLGLTACGAPSSSAFDDDIDMSKVYRWKMVTAWPPGFPVLQEGAERFADNLRVMSNGRLDIRVYAGGELIPALQTFDAVSQGSIEMGHSSAYYWAGKVPEAQFFSTVPFGMTARGMNAWLYHGGGLALWEDVYAPFNIVPMPIGNTGFQMGGWFNKKINSIDDLQGLKMRIPGLGGKVLAKAGGNPVLLAGSEVYMALERNNIDAAEWIAPYHDVRLGLHRAAKFYYYPGWQEPGPVLELMINKQAWDSLPSDLQLLIRTAAMAENIRSHAEMEYHNMAALAELRQRQDIEILSFPHEVLQTLQALTQESLEEEAENNPRFKRVYDAYQAFMAADEDWSNISESAFLNLKQ